MKTFFLAKVHLQTVSSTLPSFLWGLYGCFSKNVAGVSRTDESRSQGSFSCRVAARSMKILSPLGEGGTSGGFERGNKPPPAPRALTWWFDPSPSNTAHQPPPPLPLAPASPPRLRRGAYFQESGPSNPHHSLACPPFLTARSSPKTDRSRCEENFHLLLDCMVYTYTRHKGVLQCFSAWMSTTSARSTSK